MGLYELSIDPLIVAEAERVVSQEALAGRSFPTLVMQWESRVFDQPWTTTIVLDYLLTLPPLETGTTFIPVRLAAFVNNTPSKYFYFGTEMNNTVQRLAPELENLVAPQGLYQEFGIDERTSPIPYLKLAQATPRIYGNGPQDYYAPPIKVERFDGSVRPEQLADLFALHVAGLPIVPGSTLTDPTGGHWNGARFAGIRSIAVLRQGKVVGLYTKQGRADREVAPPLVVKRDPKLDVLHQVCAIDVGARTITVATRSDRSMGELMRIGTREPVRRPLDFENPSEVSFINLKNAMKAWRERVIQPATRTDDVRVGFASWALRHPAPPMAAGGPPSQPSAPPSAAPVLEWSELYGRALSTVTEVPLVRDWTDEKRNYKLMGYVDREPSETLKKPAPPIIDEEGIGAFDPFDPIELYGYQIGLHTNHRLRGIVTKYLVTMPTGWPEARRKSVLIALRRGIFRSLPAGMLEYHDLASLSVEEAPPTSVCFLAHAYRPFAAAPKDGAVVFGVFEMGASESGLVFGLLREPTGDERRDGLNLVIEHLDTSSIPWFGAERLLHRLAFKVYADHASEMIGARIPFEKPNEENPISGAEELLQACPEARANTYLLKELIRPLFEGDATYRLPTSVRLASPEGVPHDIRLSLNRTALRQVMDQWFSIAIAEFRERLQSALQRLARGSDPYEGLRVFLCGRMSMHTGLQDMITKSLPTNVRVHKYREPDRTNLTAPTVKTSTVLGALAIHFEKIGVTSRREQRDAFRYRVGRARHGQLTDILDPSVDYDTWRELGPCTKQLVDVLFMRADDDGEVAADDPRVMRAECDVGAESVGLRVYVRAVGTHRVEVAVMPPGEDPDDGAARCAVDLSTGMTYAL